jgi:hypothetical protein
MFLVKKWWRLRPSSIPPVMRIVNKEPFAWGIILLMTLLSLLPFPFLDKPGMLIGRLGPFIALCVLPMLLVHSHQR